MKKSDIITLYYELLYLSNKLFPDIDKFCITYFSFDDFGDFILHYDNLQNGEIISKELEISYAQYSKFFNKYKLPDNLDKNTKIENVSDQFKQSDWNKMIQDIDKNKGELIEDKVFLGLDKASPWVFGLSQAFWDDIFGHPDNFLPMKPAYNVNEENNKFKERKENFYNKLKS